MKRIAIIIAALFALTSPASAQNGGHPMSGSKGTFQPPLTGQSLEDAIAANRAAHANDPIVLRGVGLIAQEVTPSSQNWSGSDLPVTGCHPDDGSLTCPPPPSGQHEPNWRNYNPGH